MFKKLKDKITEEVKIPPIKFPQSMQQLAQAVVSPGSSSSSSSTFEPAPNDSFSIGDDFDDTPQNSPLRGGSRTEGGVAYRGGQATPLGKPSDAGSGAGFTLVDLQQDSTPQKHSSGPGGSTGGLGGTGNALSGLRSGSRRSSISSLTSDASFMFPTLETSGHTYNFQSDLESCSEASESVGPNINKEQLLSAYQKTQQRYQKYKGRYADLVRHYRELERENTKAKNILSESQDKALRRMAELKEQCNLEKQAKAHLEEALRSDLEEKDHLIHTLETKIKLLKNNAETATAPAQIPTLADVTEPQKSEPETATTSGQLESRQEDLLTSGDSGPAAAILTPELANTDTERVLREKNKKLESLLHKCREDITNKREIIKQLEAEKHTANCQVETLSQQLTVIQKREEEASLSLAKNKMTIHRELEAKEEDIKKLSAQLTTTNAKISELQDEILRVKEESKKEAAATKQEAKKSVETEIQQLKSQNKSLEETLAARDREVAAEEAQAAQALQRLHEAELELESLRQAEVEKPEASEITALKDEIAQLKASLHSATHNTDISDKLQPCLQMLRELRTASKGLRSDVDCSLSETKSFMEESLSMMQVNIGNVLADSFAELMKAVAECEVHRREAEDAKLSLEKLSEKVRTLDEILAKEKLQVAAKISSLEQELEVEKNSHQNSCAKLEQSKKEADAKISFLQESLETGKVSRQTLETETKLTLMGMEQELVEERNKLQKALVDTSSVEEKVQKIIKELKQQLKGKEKEKSHLEKELDNSKKNLKAVELELCQLKTQLNEVTKNAEKTVEDVESVNRDLTERNNHIKELEDSLRDVNVQLAQAVSNYETCQCEKKELEEKFSILGDEYETKLKELSNKCASYELSASHQEVDKAENVSKLKEEKSVLQEDIKNLKEELYEKEKCLTDLTNERDSLKAEIMSVKTNEAEAKEMIDKLQSSHKQLLDENEKRLHDLEGENGDCKGTIEKLKKELHKKNELKAKLEKSLKEMDKNFSKQNHVTEELRSGIISNEETIKALSAQLEQKEVLLREKCEECDSLMEKYENLYSEEGRKSQECLKMKAELEDANIQLMDLKNLLHEKNVQLEELQLNVSTFEREHSEGSSLLKEKEEKCIHLRSELDSLKADLTNQAQLRDSLRKEHEHQVAAFEVKAAECADLVAHVEALTSENDKISQILKQKTDECAEKEAQLDNLADEMKRVDELSQELERISDESEANVQVLSSEASSLAQKVEELTANTQQLKEREVELLAKLQVSEDLEAEYIRLKDSEAGLKEKLKLAENIGFQLKQCQEELLTKVNRIEELEVENEKLRETERTLAELIKRAKETEAKCDRLQQDDADLRARIQKAEEKDMAFSVLEEQLRTLNEEKEQLVQDLEFVKRGDADLIARIQKAEEKEMTFSVLEEQLRTLREEKEQLVQDLESVKSKSLKKHTAADNTISSSVDSLDETDDARQPVIEEPIVVKKFTPLVESDPDVQGSGEKAPKENNEWEEKYNKLLRDYSEALQKKSAEIENLKEQYIRQTREMEVRQKERLWDRQDGVVNSMDGSSNGSMGTVERLQQQLTAVTNQLKESRTLHRQEVSDLRRILLNHGSGNSMSRSDNLEDATELEYLRNILYEYMMGKEPMVLARVIAAVVKFDSDQTNKVLQKEQQRLSLLGQLGIS